MPAPMWLYSRWWTMRSRKVAAHTSRGFGRVITKQMERPGRQVPASSSSYSSRRLISMDSSNRSALAVFRLLRRQS
ncbi:hypothetical protein D3C80_2154440 [compost metagenome]